MLSLYEASYLGKEGEVVLIEAMDFTTKHLKNLMEEGSLEPRFGEHVAYALELPLNWRMERIHARWFIETYQSEATMNPLVLELAKLDFNLIQSMHTRELKEVSRWWTDPGLAQRLPFFRDRLMENYFWTVGWAFEPQFWSFREMQPKLVSLITVIDNVYDIYGPLDELEHFTNVMRNSYLTLSTHEHYIIYDRHNVCCSEHFKWDVNTIDKLLGYMKLCFLVVFNMTNDAGYRVMKNKDLDIIPYLKSAVIYTTLIYFLSSLTHQPPHTFLLRIIPLGSAELARGDVPKSIQCYKHEKNVSEDVAREKVREAISVNWRALNEYRTSSSPLEEHFKRVTINIPRLAQFLYKCGDGYDIPDGETKNQVMLLFIQPIEF
ncbi:unnamed protein product [Musa textilis]